ncbi:hypothetical protein GJ744_000894 [Endocarpon pusillum]|uniref:Uncharacterized protein n=1 Tax=Endocarpon pusillum TaxID=364733 RepID=A0A8H7AP10_9EURO|nr:hypothetical protein GJ744_000894 [Endocarpon pusillum]
MNPDSDARKPDHHNDTKADDEPEPSNSASISPADTDELDLEDYLRFRAQSRLNEARVRLLHNIQGTERHNVLLARMDRSSGELSWPQPRGEERRVITDQGMLETRTNPQQRHRQRQARNKDPAVVLRRKHAVKTWKENVGTGRRDWREARPVIETALASFGYENIRPKFGSGRQQKVNPESQEGTGPLAPPSADAEPDLDPSGPTRATEGSEGQGRGPQQPTNPAPTAATQATLPPLPTPSQILP